MNIFQRLYGRLLFLLGKIIEGFLSVLIFVASIIVSVFGSLGRSFFVTIGIGGCFLIFLFLGPLTWLLILNPVVLPVFLLLFFLFIILPILGTKLISYLEYIKYSITEYLYEMSRYFITGVNAKFSSYREYKDYYKKLEEEMKRREYQRQQAEQQRMWEERFRRWNEYQQQYRGSGSWGGYQQSGGGHTYQNPMSDFKNQYEEACDTLEVSYDADEYEIKLAYRKKAKEYHPDLNKDPGATEMFQKINSAYEFLNDDNINRYKSMN